MKITVSKLELLKECQKVIMAVETKASIPILANFLFTATERTLYISGTDLDLSLVHAMPCNVLTEGSITIPARKLMDVLKNLKTVEQIDVTITEVDNHWVTLTCGPLLVKLPGMATTNYPHLEPFPDGPNGVVTTVPGEVLAGLIARSAYAISNEESRYTLNGAMLEIRSDSIRMVATDGHRLACVTHPGEFTVPSAVLYSKTLLAQKALHVLEKLLGEPKVTIAKNDTIVFFRASNWMFRSRILTGQFPNYDAVMPNGTHKNSTVVLAKDLKASVTRVVQFADERSRAVVFRLSESGMTVLASSTEAGEASESVKSSFAGKPHRIGFNAAYVLDFLNTVGKDDGVVIKTRDEQSAALFMPIYVAGHGTSRETLFQSQNVVMPMRV